MNRKKIIFSTELAYLVGLVFIALGVVFCTKADFGLSMVVAPAYVLHVKISETFSFFTFGMAEYCLQGLLVILTMIIVRKFRVSYFFSFVTAVLYGVILDGLLYLFSSVESTLLWVRILFFVFGIVITSTGVSLMFHTYIPQEAYELIVKEVADAYSFSLSKTKTTYDLISLSVAVLLSFLFFGFGTFVGVNIGTLVITLVNGWLIGLITRFLEKLFDFQDRLPLKKQS